MDPILYIDRQSKKIQEEKIYFKEMLFFLYGNSLISRFIGTPLVYLISCTPFFSSCFGLWNKLSFTKKKILPFISRYNIDSKEFLKPVDAFSSFNDFFTRKLKPTARPLAQDKSVAIIPADGRYLFYPDISKEDGFLVKGEKFNLKELLKDEDLAKKYEKGTLIIARLCPTDYHRYHFPVDCLPGKTKLINGYLYSVNPIALKKDISILTKNKRTYTTLDSKEFGRVLFIEVGATNVGSINQTYTPGKAVKKGDEKGFFSFGASTILLIFEKNSLTLDKDLIEASSKRREIRCLMGERMGICAREKKKP